jgi:O-antigen/teichoic acid export membrane protein
VAPTERPTRAARLRLPIRRVGADLLPVTGSKILHSGLAFAYAAIVANFLGPSAYGLLAISLAVTAIAAEITGQGLEVTMVRIAARSGAAGRPGLASPPTARSSS